MGNPKMGDVVFYISPDQVQDFKGLSKTFAAIVTRVFQDGTVNLAVLDDRHQTVKHEHRVKQITKSGQTAVFFMPQAPAAAAPVAPPPPPPPPAPIPTAPPAPEPTTPAAAPTPIVTEPPPVAEAAAPAPSV
ncbi:MAG TPA: hypothetical protein VKW04_18160 [Planctomycetota bacterium]|nr:hypothetical protein [Planctomycetota bacterium]